LDDGLEEAWFCRSQSQVRGRRGELVSLIPWGAAVEGVTTDGLRWALHSETLYPEKTRGISNELVQPVGEVRITSGLLLIVHRRQTQPEIEESEAKKTS
jgi:thiamine pyrophosphokinase